MSRRSTRKRSNSAVSISDIAEEDETIKAVQETAAAAAATATTTTSRRSSSRSNKFVASFKEPENNIKDLLGGLSERVPVVKKKETVTKRRKKAQYSGDDSDEDMDMDMDMDVEDEIIIMESESSDELDEDDYEDERKKSSKSTKSRSSKSKSSSSSSSSSKTKPPPRRNAKRAATNTVSRSSSSSSNDFSTPKQTRSKSSRNSSSKNKNAKSPAVRHSNARRQIKLSQVPSSGDESESASEYSSSDDEDDNDGQSVDSGEDHEKTDLKIQRILAVKVESKRKWKEICQKITTTEIDRGSRWFQEDESEDEADGEAVADADAEDEEELDKFEERFLVKWSDLGFLHCSWERKEDLIDQVEGAKTYLTTFFRKSHGGYYYDADERMDGEFFDPEFVQIDRILEVTIPEHLDEDHCNNANASSSSNSNNNNKKGKQKDENSDVNEWGIIMDENHPDYEYGTGREFLIKWGNSQYSDSTYEYERDLICMDVDYESHVQKFLERNKKPTRSVMKKKFSKAEEGRRRHYKIFGDRVKDGKEKEEGIEKYKKDLEEKVFANGGQLRDYQAEGVSWLLANHVNERSAILADEMGLGKTIQTAAYIQMIHEALHCRGPFLIVAPLSTIPHWQREFDGWTAFNTIVYHGSQQDRKMIREFEFAFECDRPKVELAYNQRFLTKCRKKKETKAEKLWMAQVVITTPEMLVTDDFAELTAVEWELLVVDEAHRLKSNSSKLAVNLRDNRFVFNHTLLLTGTPIQNNMNELWSLMNVIDPDTFDDCDEFMERFDNMQSKERVDELHGVIRPYILRRLKEDVEKSVPPKEETVIEVELTVIQKQYYRALYEKNVQFLHRDVKKALDGPSLNNLSMQLRKCCNHPFLLEGVEEKAKKGLELKTPQDEADFLAKSSGKLVLLDKLLPKLKDGGHRVLIFSQFKIMLDIIEDYLALREFKFERIDGSITGKKRQMAIDRFQMKGATSDTSFVMLLSTRAGGVGINLTAADTCIIFDSDWNPQNDLQAQARCHRIGQTKSVKIYRLLARKTYEMQMFHMSSLKMGLDQAVLQGIENGGGSESQNMTKEEVEKLLRHGAYDMFREENEGAAEKESNEFIGQDIDTILERRAKTIVHENTGSGSKSAGGTFSKASFSNRNNNMAESDKDVDIDDPDFWTKMVGEAKVENDDILMTGTKRSRKKDINYSERSFDRGLEAKIRAEEDLGSSDISSGSDEDSDESFDDEDKVPESVDEFNFNADHTNIIMHQLMNTRRSQLAGIERKRWGGSSPSHWKKSDAELVIKLLHRFGYGNVEWKLFLAAFRDEASKKYDDSEIKRMCWSFLIVALLESVDDSIMGAARRIRLAQSEREKLEENVADKDKVEVDTESEEWRNNQQTISFSKIWSSNKWALTAVQDAISFGKNHPARDPEQLETSSETETEKFETLLKSFNSSILPALQNRGWLEENATISGRVKRVLVAINGKMFYSAAEVLEELPKIHPELEGLVQSVITAELKRVTGNGSKADVEGTDLKLDNIRYQDLSLFVKRYAPMQLLADKRISFSSQRIMSAMNQMRNAHVVTGRVKVAKSPSDAKYYVELSKLLDVNPKASLPHPQWNCLHDAALVTAIVKHGWIDRDCRYRAIMEDKDLKWPSPFGEGHPDPNGASGESSSKVKDLNTIISVAKRAAIFLNSEKDVQKHLKGFNLNRVMNSYCIVSNVEDIEEAETSTTKWEVDTDQLKSNLEPSDNKNESTHRGESESSELPTRKDLLKRAKILLSKPFNFAPTNASKSDSEPKSHGFSMLDQGNICNVFLAELLREAIKVRQSDQKKVTKILSFALAESESRYKETLPNQATKGDEDEKNCARAELEKIFKHIGLVQRNSRPFARNAKNVLRVILGLEVHQCSKPGETLFVVERKPLTTKSSSPKTSPKRKSPKKSPKSGKERRSKGVESTTGDIAVNRALSLGKYLERNMAIPDGNYLHLTSIETLLLSVLCSQGMPVCMGNNWHAALDGEFMEDDSYALSWFQTGSVLEAAAETWYNMTANRVARDRGTGEISLQLAKELQARQMVYSEAASLRQNPGSLAKKSIMLIQAVRLHTNLEGSNKKGKGSREEPRIGRRTVRWSSNHMVKWAQALGIFFEGKVIANTVIAARPNVTAAAYLDEDGCTNIYCQIIQQTRLRALLLTNEDNKFLSMLPSAIKNCDSSERDWDWDDRPSWWGKKKGLPIIDDENLVTGILQYGYGGFDEMIRQNKRFQKNCNQTVAPSIQFDRLSAQHRLDCLTRELGALDDASETMRIMKHDEGKQLVGTSSVQVGIGKYFTPSKKSTGTAESEADDDSVEIIETGSSNGKRKASMSDSPGEKKTKL